MVSGWWQDHCGDELPLALLPPVGLVVEADGGPVCACWLYLAAGIGVCWLEWPVARPGLTLRESCAAFSHAVECLEEIARTHDYGVMVAHTLPPIARMMKGMGFHMDQRQKVTVTRRIA